jgi:predicted nucleic acid-binding protein
VIVFTALLDANVLWPAALRDVLLRAAQRGLYHPVWSRAIRAEAQRALVRRRPDLDPAKLTRTFDLMDQHFPDSSVEDYETLVPEMQNQRKDRHVLAAAVRAGAQVIVTFNAKDFPHQAVQPHNIEVQIPDEFLCRLWELDAGQIAEVLREQAASLRNPPRTALEVLANLGRAMPRFETIVRQSRLLESH